MVKNLLHKMKKKYYDIKTPKINFALNDKIAVIEGACEVDYNNLNSQYVIVNNLNKIKNEDYSKISIYMGSPDKQKLKLMTSLKWLQLSSAGVNGYDNENLYFKMPYLTTAKGIYGVPIAECVIADILFLMKPALSNTINEKYKIPPLLGMEFANSSVLVCGLGDIGRNVAIRCKGMKCSSVIGIDSYIPEKEIVDEVYPLEKLDSVIGKADIVVSALPDNEKTRMLFNEKMISKMKKNAIFVNVGRGSAVDQKALLKAIKNKCLFGAALDVTTPDPVAKIHPLKRNNRILVTDHLACISRNNSEKLKKFYYSQFEKYINGDIK